MFTFDTLSTMRADTLVPAALQFAVFGVGAPQVEKRYTQSQNDITYNVAKHAATSSKLRYVKNSGICETTKGVNQYSGYADVCK